MPRPLLLLAALGTVALTGCGPGVHGHTPAMMGGGSSSGASGAMGGGSGYRLSTLTCGAPADLPGRTVNVLLGDRGMTQMMGGSAPLGTHMLLRADAAALPAGRITVVAANRGWRTHELVVLPLADGQSGGHRVPGGDGTVDEKGSVGEASASCAAGHGDGIRAGTVSWTTMTLTPGRYELVCNLANHYADGMHQDITVTAP